jgi:hypothetical protein
MSASNAHCAKTRVILDMAEPSEYAKNKSVFAPGQCPGCKTQYDSAIQENVNLMQRIYGALLPVQDRVTFIAESPQPQPTNA